MKMTVILSAAVTALLVIAAAEQVFAQEGTSVKVKGSEIVTGVVIVDILKDGTPLELQCNQGAANCNTLKRGGYVMVELPKNFGMYDCKNVEIYREEQDKPQGAELVGKYCLVEK
jgi:nitrous oxidase accessory protein NosD